MTEEMPLAGEKLAAGLRIAGVGLAEIDYLADTITLDARAAALFELPADHPVPRDTLHGRMHPDDWAVLQKDLGTLLAAHEADDVIDITHRIITPGGETRWVKARKQVYFNPERSRPTGGFVAVIDVTAEKSAEERIAYVMQETAHRSKNLMAVVSGIAGMVARDETERAFAKRFAKRLSSLASNLDLLVRGSWQKIGFKAMVETQLAPFVSDAAEQVVLSGPDLDLSPDAAQTLGMVLHELGTNAAKYGALSVPGGRLDLRWTLTDGRFRIFWVERGGPAVVPPDRQGFGHIVTKRMAAMQVGGEVSHDYAAEGFSWTLDAPAEQVLATP